MCTVNFAQLALVLNLNVKRASNFKRIQHFVKGYLFVKDALFNSLGHFMATKENGLPWVWIARIGNFMPNVGGIEIFFVAWKTRGFNFEDTHLTKLPRINTLIFIIAIAFIWALKTGEYQLENGHQIHTKNFKDCKTKLFSIFRVGLDHLKEKLLNFLNLGQEIKLMSCT